MKKRLYFIVLFLLTFINAQSQIILTDDYSNSAFWTKVIPTNPACPNDVSVNSASNPDVCSFTRMIGQAGSDSRVYRQFNSTLSNQWTVEFDFYLTDQLSSGAGFFPIILTAGAQPIDWDNGFTGPTNQDAIGICCFSPGNGSRHLMPWYKDGTSSNTHFCTFPIDLNKTYRVKLYRTSSTECILQVYVKINQQLIQIGNDCCFTIPLGVNGLKYVQTGNGCSAGYHFGYWGYVDNLLISNNSYSILGNDTTICGGSLTLDAGNLGCTYLWNTSQTTQTINVTTAGTYWVQVTNSVGCIRVDTIIVYAGTMANFNIPDTICVNQPITIQNTSSCGSTYYWNFCSGSLASAPIGLNMGNLGSLSGPVYTSIAKDGNNYYVFITNYTSGTLTRLSFGNSLINTPVATNLGNLGGVLGGYLEGVQIKKDSITGNWYGLIVNGQNNYIVKLSFGTNLANTPTAVNLGNLGGLFNYPHSIYTFNEGGNWYSLITNFYGNNILKLSFGNSLANAPSISNLGNIGNLNGPVGLYPIIENNIWYVFVTNQYSNSLSRLSFGNSLLNSPTGINIGNINNTMHDPRAIAILRDCGNATGFVINEITNDLVRLTFPSGLSSTPVGTSLGNLAGFSFPHHISDFFRVGDSLYTFIVNEITHTISRICFPSCTNASIPSSNLQNPPVISFNATGTYNVNLTVNEGLPSQSNMCKNVVVISGINVNLGNDTTICQGNNLTLNAGNLGCTYLWSTNQTTQTINISSAGTYWVQVTNAGGCIASDTINVNISNHSNLNLGNDTSLCIGQSITLDAGNGASTYLWNTGVTTQTISVNQIGSYWVTITNGLCSASDTISIISIDAPPIIDLGNDTLLCQGTTLTLSPGIGFTKYLWSTGSTLPQILVTEPGNYSVTVWNGNCPSSDNILLKECESEIWIPNVFTPNGDGINDEFYPVYSNIEEITLYIFNRWGNQIFEGSGINARWNGIYKGKLCPDGVYTYLINYVKKGAHAGPKEKHGSITLLK